MGTVTETALSPDELHCLLDDYRAGAFESGPDTPGTDDVLEALIDTIAAQRREITELRAAVAMQTGRVDALASIWTALAEQLSARQGIHCTTDETAAYLANGIPFPDATDPIRG